MENNNFKYIGCWYLNVSQYLLIQFKKIFFFIGMEIAGMSNFVLVTEAINVIFFNAF